MVKSKAIMIGAGLSNMAAAVYLIQDGHWDGKDITFYGVAMHGATDGGATTDLPNEYWTKNQPMANTTW